MNRRNLFKGVIGTASALILPATLEENAEAGKRIWALGGIPEELPAGWEPRFNALMMRRYDPDMSFMDPVETPMIRPIDYDQVIHDASVLYEVHYPLRRPMVWQIRAVDNATMLNAGYLVGERKV